MKRLVLAFAFLAVVACTSESNFPNPTGKGTVRAINAMSASPEVGFFIVERRIGQAGSQEVTATTRWDDFGYVFNFEVSFPGEITARRIASSMQKIDAGRDYTFVLTGDVEAPIVSVWEGSEREWDGSETVFEVRFANVAEQDSLLGLIDVYLAPDGTAPVAGEQIATLDFGEIMPAIDMEAVEYVLTLTRAGDPMDILFQSRPATFVAQTAVIAPIFDVDERETASLNVLAINTLGPSVRFVDTDADPTIRFVQASLDLPDSDVYDDDMQTNLILTDHVFGDITDDIPISSGTTTHYYTPAGEISPVLFEGDITARKNSHWNWLVVGREGDRFASTYIPTRRSISIYAQVSTFHAAFNNQEIDLYVVDAGLPIDDANPAFFSMRYTFSLRTLNFAAGSYDLYATLPGEKTILGGPVTIDVVDGDVVEIMLFDMVDPAVVDIRILPPQ